MTNKQYRFYLEARLKVIERETGENYKLDYSAIYGGWRISLFVGTTEVQGQFGNYLRYSSAEMLRYLDGITYGLTAKKKK